jgi:hypothetical protein
MPISNGCPAEEILLWIHKGQVVTVWSSVLWTSHLEFASYLNDRSMQDNRVGVRGIGGEIAVSRRPQPRNRSLPKTFSGARLEASALRPNGKCAMSAIWSL